jgi:hypothetical protein
MCNKQLGDYLSKPKNSILRPEKIGTAKNEQISLNNICLTLILQKPSKIT